VSGGVSTSAERSVAVSPGSGVMEVMIFSISAD
jgi:hypothetical protein